MIAGCLGGKPGALLRTVLWYVFHNWDAIPLTVFRQLI
jgi:hypothetical protein